MAVATTESVSVAGVSRLDSAAVVGIARRFRVCRDVEAVAHLVQRVLDAFIFTGVIPLQQRRQHLPRVVQRAGGAASVRVRPIAVMGGGVSGVVSIRAHIRVALNVVLDVAFGIAAGVTLGVAVSVTLGVALSVTLSVALGVALGVALSVTVNAADHLAAVATLGVAFRFAVAGIHRHAVARLIWRRASERGNGPQGQQGSERYRQQSVEPATKQRHHAPLLLSCFLICL